MKEFRDIYQNEQQSVYFNPEGMSEGEQTKVINLAIRMFETCKQRFPYILQRCTFFADPEYDALVRLVANDSAWQHPRIEGYDTNPFDQHYWVACDLVRAASIDAVIFDPIFGYVGLERHAPSANTKYYRRKRTVTPHTAAWEGGVRIKTIGI